MGKKLPRPTIHGIRVLAALLEAPPVGAYGLELMRHAGVSSGTLYPLLTRYEAAGFITGQWEDIDQQTEGRRRRRYYKISGRGVEAYRDWLSTLSGASTVIDGLSVVVL